MEVAQPPPLPPISASHRKWPCFPSGKRRWWSRGTAAFRRPGHGESQPSGTLERGFGTSRRLFPTAAAQRVTGAFICETSRAAGLCGAPLSKVLPCRAVRLGGTAAGRGAGRRAASFTPHRAPVSVLCEAWSIRTKFRWSCCLFVRLNNKVWTLFGVCLAVVFMSGR